MDTVNVEGISIFRTVSNNHFLFEIQIIPQEELSMASKLRVLRIECLILQDWLETRRRISARFPLLEKGNRFDGKDLDHSVLLIQTRFSYRGEENPLLPLILWLPRTSVRPLNRTHWISNIC